MTFATKAAFDAPADIVFDALTDPIGMSRWLPHDVSRNPIGEGMMQVARGTSSGPVDDTSQTFVAQEQVEMTYLPQPDRGWVVKAIVTPLPDGGSSLDVTVEPQGDCRVDEIPRLVERALHGLQREVSERFTAQ
jgi:uncharacterized protein YndB with AHSA1/START domain